MTQHLLHPFRRISSFLLLLLFSCGQPSTETLIHQLTDPSSKVRSEAAYALVNQGRSSVQQLVDVIADGPDTLRYIGAQILGRIGSPVSAEALLSLTRENNLHVRKEAIRALGKIHRPDLIDTLEHFVLVDNNSEIRAAAIEGISSLRDTGGVGIFCRALSDTSSLVRKQCLISLGRQWNKSAEKYVIHSINDSDLMVRYVAIQLAGVRRLKAASLPLRFALEDTNIHIRSEAIKSISLLQDNNAVQALERVVKQRIGPDADAALKVLEELTGAEYIVR